MKIILIDGNSLMYRAYYGTSYTGNLMKTSKGVYTNAVFAFSNMLNKIIDQEYDGILVAFDKGKHTFRHDIYSDYKGGRSPMPDEMRPQIPLIKEMLDHMNIKRLELDLYEADDIIGTMSKIASLDNIDVAIYSSDKDLFQLIDERVSVYTPGKSINELEKYDIPRLFERYELKPSQMIDLKALMGDNSDNLKGIPGVGEKTAIKLLKEYETIDGLYENVANLKGALKEKVINGKENCYITRQMVTIKRDTPIDLTIKDILKEDINYEALKKFYSDLEFTSLIKKLKKPEEQLSLFEEKTYDFEVINESNYEKLYKNSYVYLENFNENYHIDSLIGIGVCNEFGNFFIKKELINEPYIKEFLEGNYEKYTFDYKKIIVTLNKYNLKLNNVKFDLLLGLYVLNPNLVKEELASILNQRGFDGYQYDELIYLSGSKKRLPDFHTYSCHISKKANGLSKVTNDVIIELKNSNQLELFNLELKLSEVLASMEIQGMKIDLEELNRQKKELQTRLRSIEDIIFNLAGMEFNINSVKQLGQVLFEKLNLPILKKNKSGYSTNSEVLQGLRDKHPIIEHILEYRMLMKLYTTYIEGIKEVVREDNKVHTIFKQALTQTGRLSSIEPNLQNISVRTLEGRQIRKIFIPENDYILSLDYSQIELRVLAHVANVSNLIKSFNNNEDIHEQTAKLILNKDEVTKQERNSAKAINFGIIYGMQAYTLANDINTTVKEAQEFIDKYFIAYPEIKTYMDKQISDCKELGYVTTIKNRRRYIPDINSSTYQIREFGKRTAMNAPIQGSAADIIKMAMIDVYEAIKNKKSKMISQVHDELIFDCSKDEIDEIIQIVKDKMENVIKLSVPLIVDGTYGKTWFEAK